MSVNKACLLGNVTKDPSIQQTKDGKEIANFSIATSEKWKNKDGTKGEKTEYHKVVIFSQGLVGIVKNYVKKGSKLYLEGQLKTREWQDKQGVKHYTTEIVLNGFSAVLQLLDSKQDSKMSKKDEQVFNDMENNFNQELDDGVPF